MTLETMQPNPVWDASAHEETVEVLSGLDDATIHVWGADWCGDCRSALPNFAAALEAAGLSDSLELHEVNREKQGELVDEYDVAYIPTVVVERDGTELARFVESEAVPVAVYLADELQTVDE